MSPQEAEQISRVILEYRERARVADGYAARTRDPAERGHHKGEASAWSKAADMLRRAMGAQ